MTMRCVFTAITNKQLNKWHMQALLLTDIALTAQWTKKFFLMKNNEKEK